MNADLIAKIVLAMTEDDAELYIIDALITRTRKKFGCALIDEDTCNARINALHKVVGTF